MEPTSEGLSQQAPQVRYARVYAWLGKPVILNYMNGPIIEDPWEIAKGQPEARAGVFALEEVSGLGVVVSKLRQGGQVMPPVFIPWSAIHSIQEVPTVE